MLLNPAAYGVRSAIELLHVGFDVENRRAIQHVHFREVKPVALSLLDLHDGQPDVIGAVWTADGKDAVFLLFKIRLSDDLFPIGQMEVVEQNGMGEAVQVFEATSVLVPSSPPMPRPSH